MLEAPPTTQSAFIAHAAQQAAYTPGYDRTAMGGIPQLGLANMVALPVMNSMMSQLGMFPGQFSPHVNVADLMRAEQERVEVQRRMAVAAQQTDVDTWINQQQGLMSAIDAPFGLEQQAAFRRTYRAAAPMLSLLGQVAPELVDALHGSRGSAALMARGLARGGQYRFDAIGGSMGLSGAAADQMQRTIAESLYGTPEATAQMLGVGMGQLGQIYDESARRGLLPGSISARGRDTQLRQLAEFTGRSQDELRGLDAEQMGQQLTRFDTARTASRLKELAGSISAMRELFGSQGQPNAPMAVLMNALESITQNRLASMPAAQVEQLVRRTKNVIETTGMSLDALMGLSTQGAQYGDALGLDRSLAPQSAMRAAAFGSSYKNTFGSDYRAFGAMSADEVTGRDNMLRQRAAGSQQAQLAGAVIRAAEQFELAPDTQIGKLAAALRRGETSFEGRSMYSILRSGELSKMMDASGVSAAESAAFRTAMRDKFGNQEYIERYELGALARRLQPQEVADTFGRAAGENAVLQALRSQGVPAEEARDLARKAGPALLRDLMASDDPAALSTAAGRSAIMRETLRRELGADKAASVADAVALSFESQANMQAKRYGFNDLGKLLQLTNETTLRNEQRVTRTARVNADIDRALAPLGKAGPLQRVMDMLQNGDSDDTIQEQLGTALGGIKAADVRRLLDQQQAVRRLRDKDSVSAEDEAAATAAEATLTASVAALVREGERTGVDIGRVVDDKALNLASTEASRDVAAAVRSRQTPRIAEAVKTQLARSNNLVQALYVDDKALRRMGPGGLAVLQQAEQQYLQLLRATDGDTELLAKALAGDSSVPADIRNTVRTTQAALSKSMDTIRDRTVGGAGMSDATWDAELKDVKKFRESRTADDAAQQRELLDKLASSAGLKPADLSAADRKALEPLLGAVDSTRRRDVAAAIDARDKLAAAAAARRVSIADLRSDGSLRDEFAQAGALAEVGTTLVDVHTLRGGLERFGPPAAAKPDRAGPASGGPLEITGRLVLVGDGTADLSASGYSSGR